MNAKNTIGIIEHNQESIDIQEIIKQQINAKELIFAKFKILPSIGGDGIVIFNKRGTKRMDITYNRGRDTYHVQLFTFTSTIKIEGCNNTYCDVLADMIQDFFKFQYIRKPIFVLVAGEQ